MQAQQRRETVAQAMDDVKRLVPRGGESREALARVLARLQQLA